MIKLQKSKIPLSDVLTQDLLVDILIERFQVSWHFFYLWLATVVPIKTFMQFT